MEDDDRRCPEIDWLVRVGMERAYSKKKAARILQHITNAEPGELCRDCHPLGGGYRLAGLMSVQEDIWWRRGFHIIGGVIPAEERPATPPPEPRSVRISARARANDAAFRHHMEREAVDAELRRLGRQMHGLSKPIQDHVFHRALHPPAKSELH